jgi:hypothetical protein
MTKVKSSRHQTRFESLSTKLTEVFVCATMTPGPNPTSSGMFTNVPARNELSSNVGGFDLYNKDNRTIGTSRISL